MPKNFNRVLSIVLVACLVGNVTNPAQAITHYGQPKFSPEVHGAFLQQALSNRSACTPTPDPSLTSGPTSNLFRETIDTVLAVPTGPNGEPLDGRLAASLAEGARKVISWDGQGVVHILGFKWPLGGAALTLPTLVQSLLLTFPGLQKLVVEHNNIGLLGPLIKKDPRIEETAKVDRRVVPGPRPGMCGNSFSVSLLVRPPSYLFRRSPVFRFTPCL
jgi:hypothetical protein